jgi:hypothetical protein
MRPWVVFFSQTGTDIYNLSKKLNRSPDLIITNKQCLDEVNPNLINDYGASIFQISKSPIVE